MARIGRFVVPDLPHHVTQRGNRREKVSFSEPAGTRRKAWITAKSSASIRATSYG
jgi:REP element-mobilizing transposase RayT